MRRALLLATAGLALAGCGAGQAIPTTAPPAEGSHVPRVLGRATHDQVAVVREFVPTARKLRCTHDRKSFCVVVFPEGLIYCESDTTHWPRASSASCWIDSEHNQLGLTSRLALDGFDTSFLFSVVCPGCRAIHGATARRRLSYR